MQEFTPDTSDETCDTLEGTSIPFQKSRNSRRSSLRNTKRVSWAPIEDRGARRESLGSKMRKSSILHLQLDLSSDFEDENVEQLPAISLPKRKILGENVSLSESISTSPIASPGTMLSRLEALEDKGGRKKRSRSKSLITSTNSVDPTSKVTEKKNAIDLFLKLPDDEGDTDRLLMPPPTISVQPAQVAHAVIESSFLIVDNDLTVVENFDMSISDSVSNVIMCDKENTTISENRNEDNTDNKNVKKFFQHPLAQETSSTKEINTTLNKNTPYDISLMEETGVGIIPFSSKNDFKENFPPTKNNRKNEKDSKESMRRCSIILNDIIDSPRGKDMVPPDIILSPEVRLSLCSPIHKIKSSKNTKESLCLQLEESVCTNPSPTSDKEKGKSKANDIQDDFDMSKEDHTDKENTNDCVHSFTKQSSKNRPSLSLKSRTKKLEDKDEDEVLTNGRKRTQILYFQNEFDSSADMTFSNDDDDESWCKTPLKLKKKNSSGKSVGSSHKSLATSRKSLATSRKSLATSRKSLAKTKSIEASENRKSILKLDQKKSSRSKKSKLSKDTSIGHVVSTELKDNDLNTASEEVESTELEPASIHVDRLDQKKKSRSKKSKLSEDTSIGHVVSTGLKDNDMITASEEVESTELEPASIHVERL
ncbi:unnamed protein product, partial [Meganyctiphanes norvegica]